MKTKQSEVRSLAQWVQDSKGFTKINWDELDDIPVPAYSEPWLVGKKHAKKLKAKIDGHA